MASLLKWWCRWFRRKNMYLSLNCVDIYFRLQFLLSNYIVYLALNSILTFLGLLSLAMQKKCLVSRYSKVPGFNGSTKLYFLCGFKNLSNEFLGLRPKLKKKSRFVITRSWHKDCSIKFRSKHSIVLSSTHTAYSWNIIGQKWEGDCGLWVLNKIIFKKYTESLKKIVGAVWELPAK